MKIMKVIGPPGTGKTRRLLELFSQELKTVRPDRIAFLTFTRAARAEAQDRAALPAEALPFLRTIHSICYRQLGLDASTMLKPKQIAAFGKQLGLDLSGHIADPWAEEPQSYEKARHDELLQLNHLGRHRCVMLKEVLAQASLSLDFHYAKWFTQAYRKWKDSEGLRDYTDLLTEYVRGGAPLPIDVLFVDEAQDLSRLQWKAVHRLGREAKRFYMAGDDDQAIFSWAGASAAAFIEEPAHVTEPLTQSYRVPQAVWRVARRIIARVRHRIPKTVTPRDAEGVFRPIGFLDPALLAADSVFILFRNHYRGRMLAGELETLGVPFTGSAAPLADPEVRAACGGWAARDSRPLTKTEAKVLVQYAAPEFLTEGLAQHRLPPHLEFKQIFKGADRLEFWRVMRRLPHADYVDRCLRRFSWPEIAAPKVQLLSIHQAKGREADTVILDLQLARRTFDSMATAPDDEHRVWYVGATRARERLHPLLTTDLLYYTI